jgi:hypothetical protein
VFGDVLVVVVVVALVAVVEPVATMSPAFRPDMTSIFTLSDRPVSTIFSWGRPEFN